MSDKRSRVERRAAKRAEQRLRREEAKRRRDELVPPPAKTKPLWVPERIRQLGRKIKNEEG